MSTRGNYKCGPMLPISNMECDNRINKKENAKLLNQVKQICFNGVVKNLTVTRLKMGW